MGKVVDYRIVGAVAIAFVGGLVVGSVGMYFIQSHRKGGDSEETKATITATPVTPPVAPAKFSTTTISWDTGDGSVGQVYVVPPGQPEKIFKDNTSKGSQEAPWIYKGEYEFRLYAGKDHERVLTRVKVKWTE